MRLRTFTTVCLVAAFGLALATGLAFAARPSAGDPLALRRGYAIRLLALSTGAIASLVGAGVGSLLMLRTAREEYRAEARQNLEGLVTGLKSDASQRLSGDE